MSVRSPSDVSIQIALFPKTTDADIGLLVLVFGLPPDVVAATLGDIGIEDVVSLATGVSPVTAQLHPRLM